MIGETSRRDTRSTTRRADGGESSPAADDGAVGARLNAISSEETGPRPQTAAVVVRGSCVTLHRWPILKWEVLLAHSRVS